MFLSHEEIGELTGRKRRDLQVFALRHMGIEHRVRPDGSIAVLASHVEKVFDGTPALSVMERKPEPNWEQVNA